MSSLDNNNFLGCGLDYEIDLFSSFPKDLFTDLNLETDITFGDSIHNDCKLIESSFPDALFIDGYSDLFDAVCADNNDDKYEIRHHDCMWSGRCKTDVEKTKLAQAKVHQYNHSHSHYGHQQQQQQPQHQSQQTTSQQQISINRSVAPHDIINPIIIETVDPIIVSSPFPKPSTTTATSIMQTQQQKKRDTLQNVAPGTSLLINSRLNLQKKQQKLLHNNCNSSNTTIPAISTNDFLREREQRQPFNLLHVRPDSPLSLDDDPPEFRHSVDLSACIKGSNNISLESMIGGNVGFSNRDHYDLDRLQKVKALREQLEDSSKMITSTTEQTDLSDVLNVIKTDIEDKSDLESNAASDSESSTEEYHTKSHSPSSGYGSNSPEYNSPHSDHSYTRSKSGVIISGLGVETPSDSDEEIDVVSVGDKKLPTNPSDKDRRALQTKVANKMRIVTNSSGLKTIPPRRRDPYRSSYPAAAADHYNSTTIHTPTKTLHYPSSTASHSSSSNKYSTTTSSRKRHSLPSAYKDDYTPSSKRSRGKKQRSGAGRRHTPAAVVAAVAYDQDEADTIEKRNLHNDMERQRRIGLKNLFEALKRQIPSIKDKERAPKVNILREAAKLCEQLTREDKQIAIMKQQLQVQLQRRQALLRTLKN